MADQVHDTVSLTLSPELAQRIAKKIAEDPEKFAKLGIQSAQVVVDDSDDAFDVLGPPPKPDSGTLTITLIKSPIGCNKKQKNTVAALGLSRLNEKRELSDTPTIRGMIRKIQHLVTVEPVEPVTT